MQALDQLAPFVEVAGVGVDAHALADEVAEAGVLEDERHLVDAGHRRQRDDGAGLDVAEERDLLADLVGDRDGRCGRR